MNVSLTNYEIFLAAMVGVRRKIASSDYSKASTFIDPQVWWGSDIESACAEMAVAKALKIYWDGSVNTYSAPDVGACPAARISRWPRASAAPKAVA